MENKAKISVLTLLLLFGTLLAAAQYQTYDTGASNSVDLYPRQQATRYYAGSGVVQTYVPRAYQKQRYLVVSGDAQPSYYGTSRYPYNYLPIPTPAPTPVPTVTSTPTPSPTPNTLAPGCRSDGECVPTHYCDTSTGTCVPRATPTPAPSPTTTSTPSSTPTASPTPKPTCTDGTPAGECSIHRPKFCTTAVVLIDRASTCGCLSTQIVNGEVCVSIIVATPTPTPTPSPSPTATPTPSPSPTITPTPSPAATPTPTTTTTPTPRPTPAPTATPKPNISRLFYFQVKHSTGFEQNYFEANSGDVIDFRLSTDILGHGHSLTINEYGVDLLVTSTDIDAPNDAVFYANKKGTFQVTCGQCNTQHYATGGAQFFGTLVVK